MCRTVCRSAPSFLARLRTRLGNKLQVLPAGATGGGVAAAGKLQLAVRLPLTRTQADFGAPYYN